MDLAPVPHAQHLPLTITPPYPPSALDAVLSLPLGALLSGESARPASINAEPPSLQHMYPVPATAVVNATAVVSASNQHSHPIVPSPFLGAAAQNLVTTPAPAPAFASVPSIPPSGSAGGRVSAGNITAPSPVLAAPAQVVTTAALPPLAWHASTAKAAPAPAPAPATAPVHLAHSNSIDSTSHSAHTTAVIPTVPAVAGHTPSQCWLLNCGDCHAMMHAPSTFFSLSPSSGRVTGEVCRAGDVQPVSCTVVREAVQWFKP